MKINIIKFPLYCSNLFYDYITDTVRLSKVFNNNIRYSNSDLLRLPEMGFHIEKARNFDEHLNSLIN